MPIRITGMNSGLDTESIITALTQRYKDKVDTNTGNQKKLTWKQDKWKELNKKALSFFNGTLAGMRFSTAYNKKTTSASNESAASVITGDSAMLTDQTLNITSLAKAAYLTGNEVTYKDDENNNVKATKATTMEQLGIGATTLQFKIGAAGKRDDTLSVEIKATDKIEDVLQKLRDASSENGVQMNFNYDEANNRFFASAKKTGEDFNFEVVASDAATKLGFNSTKYIQGSSAAIELNGVEYTSNSNTFEVNGLTITAKEVASNITLSTTRDTSGIYDSIKSLLKEYNEMMKEFATAFNADKATKYKMLTQEQKDEMSDKEVEEWDKKIKDGLLAGDETLSSIRTGLKGIVSQGFDVKLKDGTTSKMYLADFGIGTGSYFNTEENERDVLHIDGDKDDATVSSNADKLAALISSDPDAVQEFFTQFSRNIYSKMTDLMQRTEYSSAYTLYEDKLMASQYSSYTTMITDAQKALEAAQDKYYKKFSTMESALAKINSSSGSLSSFFGG